jgi:zinc protease
VTERKSQRRFAASGGRLRGVLRRVTLLLPLAAIVGSALSAAAVRADAQRTELERFIQRRVLANGLEVIVIENRGVPLVTIEAVVKNGSFTQTSGDEGLAHLYEHMFFKANGDYPRPDGVMNRASGLGAIFNAETHEEKVNYYLTIPSDSLDGGLRLLSSALQRPLFLEPELAAEKVVVLGEYDRNESEPFFHFNQAMGQTLWRHAFPQKNTIGRREVLANVTTEQMRTIQQRYYVPNNTALIIAGDVAPDAAFSRAEQLFGAWPRSADPFVAHPVPPVPPLVRDTALIVEQDVGSVTVMLQWHGPSVGKDPAATFTADVFSDYLNLEGSSFQSRLVDSGLWQGVLVNYYTLDQVGPITVSGQTTPAKLREALPALMRELQRVATPGYFTADKLAEVTAHRSTDSAFGRERTSGFAHAIGFWWSVAGLEYYLNYVDEMAKQTPAELVRYARTYILGKPHVTGVMLSPDTRRALDLSTGELQRLAAWR